VVGYPDVPAGILSAVNDLTRGWDLYEQIAFVAQTLWETGGWQFVSELDTANHGSYQSCVNTVTNGAVYSGAPTAPAAGQLYYGRGLIQLSHCYNYLLYGKDRFDQKKNTAKFTSSLQFYNNPASVASDPYYTVDAALWFWEKMRPISRDFGKTTNQINGALECPLSGSSIPADRLEKAKKRYRIFKAIADKVGLASGSYTEAGCY